MTRREWYYVGLIVCLGAASLLAGCGTYAPCRYDGKAVSQHEANKMKRQGMNVECPGDEPRARTDSERFGRQLASEWDGAVMAYPSVCNDGRSDCGKATQ